MAKDNLHMKALRTRETVDDRREVLAHVAHGGIFKGFDKRDARGIATLRELIEGKGVVIDLYFNPITDFQNPNREENSFLITFGFEHMIFEQDAASRLSHMGHWFYKDYKL